MGSSEGSLKVRFDQFTLDRDVRQLVGRSGTIHLSPKAFELLTVLLENRPRVISKANLQERLWPATFVVETNIANLIAEIRQALDEDAKSPQFIRTAHRFGYAFCGEVTDISESVAASAATSFWWLIRDGLRLPLQPGENVLGRELDGGIRLDSATVSRRHARIVITGTGATLEDLGSKNGTYLKGALISSPVPLSDGDEIRVGSVVLLFRAQSGGSTLTQTSRASS